MIQTQTPANFILIAFLLINFIFTARKRSLGQGNIFAPVCHSVHRGGVSRQVHPQAGTPPGQAQPPGQVNPRQVHPLGRYTPQAGTLPRHVLPGQVSPWTGTPTPRQVNPLGRYTPRQVYPPGQVHPPWQVHPYGHLHFPRQCMLGYGQQAGGTHPTGMHSCLVK